MNINLYHRARKRIESIAVYVVLMALLLVFLFPVFWMVTTSFKLEEDFFVVPPQWIPLEPTTEHFEKVLQADWFVTYARNSLITTAATVVVTLVFGSLAGYSLSRFHFRGISVVMVLLLVTQMFPFVMYLIPFFTFFSKLNWLNTFHSLTLSYMAIALPLAIWLLKSFFDAIPIDLEEQAMIDGATRMGAFVRVILPNTLPGLVAIGMFTLLIAYDEYMFTLTLSTSDEMRTLAVGVAARWIGLFRFDWGGLMAMATLMSIPIILLFLLLQRYFISGMTAGAVKG
jgi:multiple sugar transport system permease protein